MKKNYVNELVILILCTLASNSWPEEVLTANNNRYNYTCIYQKYGLRENLMVGSAFIIQLAPTSYFLVLSK